MIKWFLHTPLFAEADDFGSSNSGGDFEGDSHEGQDDIDGDDDGDGLDDLDDDDDDDLPAKPGKGKQSAPLIDHNALAQAITGGLSPLFQQRQQATPPMSQADMDKMLGTVDVNEELITIIRDPDTPPAKAQAAIKALFQSQEGRLLKIFQYAMQGKFEELNPRLQNFESHVREQKTNALVESTIRKYPALRGKNKVVRMALQELQQSGIQPATKSEAYRLLAKRAAAHVRTVDESFSLKPRSGGPPMQTPRSGAGGGRSTRGDKFDVFGSFD